jgi:DNA polymerase-3 subunit gamma/tau
MYHALYRKYRPQNFDEVIGQEIIIRTLQNSIKNKSFTHAYLFYGPRGTGKTTVAKIFARAVNCSEPVDGKPCGRCDNCKEAMQKECVDIIEIDAASNNSVDEIRELRNKISLVPSVLKYKVYIVDEVHMLSMGAFNALLKTLEEPPDHAIFILATTELQKVPETIVSRCETFTFKRVSNTSIVDRLKFIASKEKINIDDETLFEIALTSNGGLRDALSSLDKLRSYTDDKITIDDFLGLNGLVTKKDLSTFYDSIINNKVPEVIKSIEEFNDTGKNLIQIMQQLMYYVKNNIISYYLDKNNANICSIVKAEKLVNLLNEKMNDIKRADNPLVYIEILLLKYMSDNTDDTKIISREIISSPEKIKNDDKIATKEENNDGLKDEPPKEVITEINKVEEPKTIEIQTKEVSKIKESAVQKPLIKNIYDIMQVRINNTLALADKEILNEEKSKQNKFNDYTFDEKIGYLACEILDGKIRVASKDNVIISYEYDSIVKQNLINLDKLTDVYNKIGNCNKKLAILSDEEWNNIKKEYIKNLKDGIKYEVKEEPTEEKVETNKKDDIIDSSVTEMFGDIVEYE